MQQIIRKNSLILCFESIIEVLSMFMIRIDYEKNINMVGSDIKCTYYNKDVGCGLNNQSLECFIVFFKVFFLCVGLSWDIESKEQVKFDIKYKCPTWIQNGHCFNTTNFSHSMALILNISLLLRNKTDMIICATLVNIKSCIQFVLIL